MAKLTSKEAPATGWRNRIVGHGEESAAALQANPANWRVHPQGQQEALEGVLDEVGWVQDVVVNKRTGHLVDGHLRAGAALKRGEAMVPVVYVDLSEQEEALILATMDPLAAMATADKEKLDLLLHEVQTGSAGVQAMLAELAESEGLYFGEKAGSEVEDVEPQVDRAAELEIKWGTEVGQLWTLGDHRLICGDCTDAAVVELVMGEDKAALCFTSPPYAEQRKEQYGGIEERAYWHWFRGVQVGIKRALSLAGNFVLNIKAHAKENQRSLYVFDLVVAMVRDEGWLFVDEFCWLRTGIPQQVVNRFKNAFEPCYWFSMSADNQWYPKSVRHKSNKVPRAIGPGAGDTNAARRQGRGGGAIQGNEIVDGFAYPSNVIDLKANAEALGHPAAFPVGLPSFFIRAMTKDSELVYEPFSGSGTTIIACEQLGRQCRAIEISAGYVAVALERWATATGRQPELVQ